MINEITVETGRGNYIQPSIQLIKLRNTLPALWSNDLICGPRDYERFRSLKSSGLTSSTLFTSRTLNR